MSDTQKSFGNQYNPQAPRVRVTPLVREHAKQEAQQQGPEYKARHRKGE